MRICSFCALLVAVSLRVGLNAQSATSQHLRPGVNTFGVRRLMSDLHLLATFALDGHPDWMVVTGDAVWVTSSTVNHVVRLDVKTNKPTTTVTVKEPCSGLAAGFASIWVPSCGGHSLVRVDPQNNKVVAEIAIPSGSFVPAFTEGGVWVTSTEHNLLTRVDPQSNKIVSSIPVGPQPRFLTVGADS